nr:pentatricopeptide repeat-containing protein At2g01740-like [Coffea arabica]
MNCADNAHNMSDEIPKLYLIFMTKEALKFFAYSLQRFKASRKFADRHDFNKFLHSLTRSNYGDLSLKLLVAFISKVYFPHVSAFNSVISYFCNLGFPGSAQKLINLMPKLGCLPDIVSYNSLIDGYLRNADVGDACFMMRKVCSGLMNVRPDLVTFNAMFNGFCKVGTVEELLVYMSLMWKVCVPNVVTYGILVDTYCKMNNVNMAYRVFKDMKSSGVFPNLQIFTSLIDGYCKAGELEVALGLYLDMRRNSVFPNVVTYSALIDGFCKRGMLEKTAYLFSRMLEDGVEPNIVVYTSMIDGEFKKKNVDNALKYLSRMHDQGIRLDVTAYGLWGYCVWAMQYE